MSRKDISDFDVVAAYAKRKSAIDEGWPYEILSKVTGQPEKVCYAACVRAYEHGLIDFGVSLRSGWLTDKGLELLNGKARKEGK